MITRRSFGIATLALCGGFGSTMAAYEQPYPIRPIRILVPAGPGGPTDIPARFASQVLSARFGEPAVVEHRPGAGGVVAGRELAKAQPDGYTLLSGGTGMLAVIPAMSANVGYDPIKDFAPVAEMMEAFQILVVRPSAPWKSVEELVTYAKTQPGKLTFAHLGPAHLTHLAGELFMLKSGISMVGVPYRGTGESLAGLLSGAIDMTFESITVLLPLIREGKLRALGVTSKTRTPLAPDLPTLGEAGLGDYEVTTFFGLIAPAGTPARILEILNATLNEALDKPQTHQMFVNLGALPQVRSADEFGATIAANLTKWRALGQAAHIKID